MMADSDTIETGNAENPALQAPGNPAAAGTPANASGQDGSSAAQDASIQEGLDFILDIPLQITVELGRTSMLIHDLLKLGQGSVIELHKATGETLEIMANQKLIARGEVVSVNDNYGIRLTEIVSPMERIKKLK
jgi:flagellar motor switch protein FliN/FliY